MTQIDVKRREFKNFLVDEYKNREDIGNATIYYNKKGDDADIQFCGWCITLKDDGTYFFNDTSGG